MAIHYQGDLNLPPEQFAAAVPEYQGRGAAPVVYQGAALGYDDDDDDGYGMDAEAFMGEAAGDDDEEDDDERWDRIVPRNLKLQKNYGLERQDTQHRMGAMLGAALKIYQQKKVAGQLGAGKPTFFRWLDAMPDRDRAFMIREVLQELGGDKNRPDANLKPSLVKAFIRGVKYLDSVGRRRYELSFDGHGKILQNGSPFSTQELSTVFSGRGFAIWVLSKKNRFYAASHVKGVFHHSSFMSGEHVKCGGEMVVRDGRLLLLTGKSGHYKPAIENLVYAVRIMRDGGVPLTSFKVGVWQLGIPEAVPANDFVNNWSPYESWGQGRVKRKDWDI